jgi:hypothetical protein
MQSEPTSIAHVTTQQDLHIYTEEVLKSKVKSIKLIPSALKRHLILHVVIKCTVGK